MSPDPHSGDSPEDRLQALIAEGGRLLGEERQAIFAGRLEGLADIAAGKLALLAELDAAIAGAPDDPALRAALDRLVREGRRNERVLQAARAGIAAARRRLAAIEATRRGDVAYEHDGSRIVSRDDAAGKSSRA
ncbi:hypothetical protein LNKW23_28470 [Paralimibaculum aggregatum]|uniref:Flagellar biosynthesis protein FlgN n=1 Tax=Paralimibaculum aggregatum TaxID=3036245 RepID=A0ABQ6LMU7_9RHOB|nr:hypothetical protein [Limibaculum sp. NKW23]GMG83634.1 hypothetical protein LNKW23_28470 [Limibaculum sp. NKW23]